MPGPAASAGVVVELGTVRTSAMRNGVLASTLRMLFIVGQASGGSRPVARRLAFKSADMSNDLLTLLGLL